METTRKYHRTSLDAFKGADYAQMVWLDDPYDQYVAALVPPKVVAWCVAVLIVVIVVAQIWKLS